MDQARAALSWIIAHPDAFAQALFLVLAVLNIIWAQIPKTPKNEKIWLFVRDFFQLIVTHKTEPGTFTWPYLVRIFLDAASKASGDSAEPSKDTTPPPTKE